MFRRFVHSVRSGGRFAHVVFGVFFAVGRRVEGWVAGWMDGWMDGWMGACVYDTDGGGRYTFARELRDGETYLPTYPFSSFKYLFPKKSVFEQSFFEFI